MESANDSIVGWALLLVLFSTLFYSKNNPNNTIIVGVITIR